MKISIELELWLENVNEIDAWCSICFSKHFPLAIHIYISNRHLQKGWSAAVTWWKSQVTKSLPEPMMIQFTDAHRQVSNIRLHFSRQLNCWSLRCSWSIACRRCSNYIFILNLTPGFNGLGKDNYKMRLEAFQFWDLVRLILETLRYMHTSITRAQYINTEKDAWYFAANISLSEKECIYNKFLGFINNILKLV